MDKIVVLSGNTERDDNLVRCLKMLFPECEIEIVSRRSENRKDQPPVTGYENEEILDKMLNNLMSFL